MTCEWGSTAGLSVLLSSLLFCGCATGGGSEVDSGGGNNNNNSVGGDGGTAGEGGVAGMGGTAGMGGMGGAVVPCDDPADDPCKLSSPQCGCEPGDRCILVAGGRACAPEGDKGILEPCVGNCQAGLQCINAGTGTGSFCHQHCDVDADCTLPSVGPGGICALGLNGGGQVCSHNCDPVSDTGCDANPNLKCDIGREADGAERWFSRCLGAGTLAFDAVCTGAAECSPGSSCIPIENEPDSRCLAWCTNPGTGGTCPQGASHICNGFGTPILIGAVEYGACVPLAGFP